MGGIVPESRWRDKEQTRRKLRSTWSSAIDRAGASIDATPRIGVRSTTCGGSRSQVGSSISPRTISVGQLVSTPRGLSDCGTY